MKKLYRKGFTLIELLVVIAIIGILAAIVLVSLNTARSKARDTRRAADLNQVQLALEMYFDSNGYYPDSVAASCIWGDATANGVALDDTIVPTYMPALPQDPQNTGNFIYRYCTNMGATHTATRYIVAATLENNNTTGPLGGDLNDCTNLGATPPAGCTGALPLAAGCVDPVLCFGI